MPLILIIPKVKPQYERVNIDRGVVQGPAIVETRTGKIATGIVTGTEIVIGREIETGTEIATGIGREIVIGSVFVIMIGTAREDLVRVKNATGREMIKTGTERTEIVIGIERGGERDLSRPLHYPELVLHLDGVSVH